MMFRPQNMFAPQQPMDQMQPRGGQNLFDRGQDMSRQKFLPGGMQHGPDINMNHEGSMPWFKGTPPFEAPIYPMPGESTATDENGITSPGIDPYRRFKFLDPSQSGMGGGGSGGGFNMLSDPFE